ncbi:MAG: L-lactate dehydrogenase, partial [Clostridia bacterium]|nr:L-lactate dehydrogenase [Clostridia bacterium]
IAILGTGNVGATIAYSLTLSGLCSEIVLVDINKAKAEGEALDLSQCAACVPSVKVWSGEYEDVAGADIVVVTFGIGRKPDQTRLDLAKVNVGILQSVMPNVAKIAPEALYVIVSNPVDVLTYATIKCTGLPANRVIGTGTLLDSNRLIKFVADYCKIDSHNVTAYVLGEHGDACMAPWSLCTVAGLPVKEYAKRYLGVEESELNAECDKIYTDMVKSGSTVIKAKGATFYAIAASVMSLIKALFADTHTLLPLSTILHGEYGAENLCMGVPCIVGGNGLEKVVELPLTAEEKKLMSEKVASLNATYDALNIRN